MTPLVPPDVDLKDFAFMPMDVHRLLTSETWLLGTGDERAAAITLWMVSWHQVPAGSLPSNERMLAHLSLAKNWGRVKAHALRGWVLADDGRYYHPVVAEKVLEGWLEKLAQRISSGSGNARRWGSEFDAAPIEEQMRCAREMLMALNPQSRALSKRRTAGVLPASRRDNKSHPVGNDSGIPTGIPSGSQETETGIKDQKLPPVSPKGDQPAKPKGQTLKAWLDSLPDGAPAIPEDHHVFAYADRVSLPHDFVGLAWEWFQRKYLVDKPRTRQLDWPGKFRNAVEDRWGNLWWINHAGAFELTTAGQQLRRSIDAEAQERAA